MSSHHPENSSSSEIGSIVDRIEHERLLATSKAFGHAATAAELREQAQHELEEGGNSMAHGALLLGPGVVMTPGFYRVAAGIVHTVQARRHEARAQALMTYDE